MRDLACLNERFGIPGQVRFGAGPGGLTVAEMANAAGTAQVALHGAHVLAFQPVGARPVLWLSSKSWFCDGKPIRGGIPVCWPWFGAHPGDPSLPSHGFARLRDWEVRGTRAVSPTQTCLRLGLRDSEDSRRVWPHAFEVELEVALGSELRVALAMRNPGTAPYTVSAALHTYFAVSDVSQVHVQGFDGCPYLDTVNGANRRGVQTGAVTVAGETDLVFTDCDGDEVIEDPSWHRRIRVRKAGSRSAVVWNPWIAKAKRMPDYGDDEYPGMICVETTNAAGDARTVVPGGEHCLQATLSVEPLG